MQGRWTHEIFRRNSRESRSLSNFSRTSTQSDSMGWGGHGDSKNSSLFRYMMLCVD